MKSCLQGKRVTKSHVKSEDWCIIYSTRYVRLTKYYKKGLIHRQSVREWTRSPFVQSAACRLYVPKPIPTAMLNYCQQQIVVKRALKYMLFHSTKFIWVSRLWNGGHITRVSNMKTERQTPIINKQPSYCHHKMLGVVKRVHTNLWTCSTSHEMCTQYCACFSVIILVYAYVLYSILGLLQRDWGPYMIALVHQISP